MDVDADAFNNGGEAEAEGGDGISGGVAPQGDASGDVAASGSAEEPVPGWGDEADDEHGE